MEMVINRFVMIDYKMHQKNVTSELMYNNFIGETKLRAVEARQAHRRINQYLFLIFNDDIEKARQYYPNDVLNILSHMLKNVVLNNGN